MHRVWLYQVAQMHHYCLLALIVFLFHDHWYFMANFFQYHRLLAPHDMTFAWLRICCRQNCRVDQSYSSSRVCEQPNPLRTTCRIWCNPSLLHYRLLFPRGQDGSRLLPQSSGGSERILQWCCPLSKMSISEEHLHYVVPRSSHSFKLPRACFAASISMSQIKLRINYRWLHASTPHEDLPLQ